MDETFVSPAGATDALAWDGADLWIGTEETLLRVTTSGEVVASFDAPGSGCGAIDWDGSHLWMHDYVDISSWPVDVTLFRLTTDGTVVSSVHCPVAAPRDMAWDGSGLWIYSYRDKWYKVSPTGEVVASIETPADKGPPSGGAWDGQYLCCVEHPGRISGGHRWSELYRLDASGAVVDSFRFEGLQFWGLAAAGDDFWVIGGRLAQEYRVCKISFP